VNFDFWLITSLSRSLMVRNTEKEENLTSNLMFCEEKAKQSRKVTLVSLVSVAAYTT